MRPRPPSVLRAALALVTAALACNLPSPGPNANATVAALSTAIRQTAAVQTQAAGEAPLPAATPVTPTNTAAPATSAFAEATATDSSRPNGTALHAWHFSSPIDVSSDLAPWGRLPYAVEQPVFRPENWTGAADASLEFGLGWDAAYLYVAAIVTDDAHVQTQHGATIYKGDSLEILLDTDLAGDAGNPKLDADDYQLGLSPGALTGDGPEAFLWFPANRQGNPAGVVIGIRATSLGYTLQAAVPWSLFNVSPAAGQTYGFALSASDNDSPETAEQQTMISSAPGRKLTDPTTWGTLVLDQ